MRSPSRSPCRELETNWGNLVKVAGEIRRHEAIILSDEEPPKAVSRSADIAVRAFRKDGRVWLLAVNKTASRRCSRRSTSPSAATASSNRFNACGTACDHKTPRIAPSPNGD